MEGQYMNFVHWLSCVNIITWLTVVSILSLTYISSVGWIAAQAESTLWQERVEGRFDTSHPLMHIISMVFQCDLNNLMIFRWSWRFVWCISSWWSFDIISTICWWSLMHIILTVFQHNLDNVMIFRQFQQPQWFVDDLWCIPSWQSFNAISTIWQF